MKRLKYQIILLSLLSTTMASCGQADPVAPPPPQTLAERGKALLDEATQKAAEKAAEAARKAAEQAAEAAKKAAEKIIHKDKKKPKENQEVNEVPVAANIEPESQETQQQVINKTTTSQTDAEKTPNEKRQGTTDGINNQSNATNDPSSKDKIAEDTKED
ncbi:hypothetical protein Q7M76_03940 [Candidatus Liberibacter asiaticus]|uniref:Lipoprotein n=1 Tax=Candidatus Liberibacter asiaticus str. gxpsy TaxID=1174529 RepID=A0ABM5NG64_LIBAS|nr:hypothetical protein [Candidatus Liberibacter asiaticus]AGH17145.1 hypothetical protein WSI_03875 [Candidatus Liberibacter asiaticus str. gxpsy]ASK52945.1 hypothetical protein B2I23_04010 [Candidatus Liberibacter asiaticus]AWL14267.1 hypothetical protein DIC79_04035 [Candidatus Liberibacter asiaticus]KAE9514202.1 hypothetical protein FXW25_03740 [Candidatus Liberibacter asiaticus]KAE9515257.1 hypothetical protein FXW26_03785 [Candidatus Liberibacter asiaticus]